MNEILERPRWKRVEYSKTQIITAGKVIKNTAATEEEVKRAMVVIDNWRAAHAYPLHVIYTHLRRMAKENDEKIIVAERLKRLDSIINKLKREKTMILWTMQDLGGCRFIVPELYDVFAYAKKYKKSRIRHKFIKEYNYITQPKQSGYRSLHYVYKYYSDSLNSEIRNVHHCGRTDAGYFPVLPEIFLAGSYHRRCEGLRIFTDKMCSKLTACR